MHVWIIVGASLGGLGVVGGAFGAHALRGVLPPARFEAFQTAVLYLLIHALAVLSLGLYARATSSGLGWAPRLFLAGTALFSGSIVVLTTTPLRGIGWVTPLGGVLLIVGWVTLAFELGRSAR